MADQEIKDLIRARGCVQASLTRIQTFVQQYDESQVVLNRVIPRLTSDSSNEFFG